AQLLLGQKPAFWCGVLIGHRFGHIQVRICAAGKSLPEGEPPAAQMVARQVNRDAKEPGADFCLTAKDAAALVGPQKTLLCKGVGEIAIAQDRKSTRLNSSHRTISYAVFCLKKKKNK